MTTESDNTAETGEPEAAGAEARFWMIAEPLLASPGVTRSTMMGYPCVRINGGFFASFDRRSADLLVKLPAERVEELVNADLAQPFAPAGRRFREWAAVSPRHERSWPDLIDEALAFVAALPPTTTQSNRRPRRSGRSG